MTKNLSYELTKKKTCHEYLQTNIQPKKKCWFWKSYVYDPQTQDQHTWLYTEIHQDLDQDEDEHEDQDEDRTKALDGEFDQCTELHVDLDQNFILG